MSPWAGPHTTARNCRTCGATQLGSCTVFSAHPTVCRALFVPVLPHEAGAVVPRLGEEVPAAPDLVERVEIAGLGNAADRAEVVLDRPKNGAVRSRPTERAQIRDGAEPPQRRVEIAGRNRGVAGDPTRVVHAGADAVAASQGAKLLNVVVRHRSLRGARGAADEHCRAEENGENYGEDPVPGGVSATCRIWTRRLHSLSPSRCVTGSRTHAVCARAGRADSPNPDV